MASSRDPVPALLVALGVAAQLAQLPLTAGTVVDDAFITARVADHVLAGHGPVYDAGVRVEAFSDPAWLLLLVGGRAAGLDPFATTLAAGAAGAVLTVLLTAVVAAIAAGAFDRRAGAAALIAGASPHLAVLATSGLEGTWWTAAVLAATAAALTGRGGLAVGLLPWVRPEGSVLAPLLAVLGAARSPARGRFLAGALGPVLALHGLRGWWFGALVANPVTAKAYEAPWDALRANLAQLRHDGATWAVVALAAVLAPLAPPRRPERVVPTLVAAVLAGAMTRALEWMPGQRLVAPTWSAAAIAVATAEPPWMRVAGVTAAVALPLTPVATEVRAYHARNTVGRGSASFPVAAWLRAGLPPGATVAIRDAGAFAWALGPDVTIRETFPHPLTRRSPDPGGPLPDALVTTVQAIDQRASAYPEDRAWLDRARWRHLGRFEQHPGRWYDLWAPPGSALPPIPGAWTVPVSPPLRDR